jgi:hypothetical protein
MPDLVKISRNLVAISGGDVAAFERETANFEKQITESDPMPREAASELVLSVAQNERLRVPVGAGAEDHSRR